MNRAFRILSLSGRDIRGAIAIEFALVAPVLIMLILSTVEVVRLLRAEVIFNNATSTEGSLIAAQTGVTAGSNGNMADFCLGAKLTMAPYDTSALTMSIVSVTNSGNSGLVAMDWEYDGPCSAQGPQIGSSKAVVLGTPLIPGLGDSVIIIQASYNYTPLILSVISTPITLTTTTYTRARNGQIPCSGC